MTDTDRLDLARTVPLDGAAASLDHDETVPLQGVTGTPDHAETVPLHDVPAVDRDTTADQPGTPAPSNPEATSPMPSPSTPSDGTPPSWDATPPPSAQGGVGRGPSSSVRGGRGGGMSAGAFYREAWRRSPRDFGYMALTAVLLCTLYFAFPAVSAM
jgi:hypothetical protein